MTMIRMQARFHASEENGQSGTAEISGKLVFYSCTSRFKLMFKTLKPRFNVHLNIVYTTSNLNVGSR